MSDQEPVLPPLTNRTIVKDHSSYGRAAVAAEAIKRGEMVICEEPLLSIGSPVESKVVVSLMKQLEGHLKAHPELHHGASMIHQEDWAAALNFYLAYCKASEETQQLVLQEMFNSPTGEDVEDAAPLRRTLVEAQAFAGMAPEITKVLKIFAAVAASSGGTAAEVKPASDDPQLVQRVLLASELNVHTLGVGAAMYKAGSKLTHTCDSPNTYYISCAGRGCHIALRDIAAGELLTTTYLVPEMQLLSVFGRKRYLWSTFAFDCACQRCTSQIDKLSAFPCNRCATPSTARSKDGFLPMSLMAGLALPYPASSSSSTADGAADGASSSSSSEVPGLLLFDPRKADAAVMRTHHLEPKQEESSCCGCDHDHGDGHDHHHHHDHDHDHSHNGHSHKHEHKAAGAAAAGAAAAGAASGEGGEGGEEAAAAAAEPAGPPCWQCNKCGLQLPDKDTELVGDYKVVRDASVRFERWAYSVAVHFDPQGEHADADLRKVQLLLGPYHWALHFMLTRQNELFTSIVRTVGMHLAQGAKVPPQFIDFLHKGVAGLRLNSAATWAWLTGPVGMSVQAAADVTGPAHMRSAMSLVDTSIRMLGSPRFASSQADLIARMLALAGDLLAKAEPSMERFQQWPLPEPHPLVRGLAEVRLYMAKAAEMAPAAAASSACALNMDQLLDFLPAGGGGAGGKAAAGKAAGGAAGSTGGAGKGKAKKKAGGKK